MDRLHPRRIFLLCSCVLLVVAFSTAWSTWAASAALRPLARSRAAVASGAAEPASGPAISARARQIAQSAVVIDTHADTPQWMLDGSYDFTNPDNTQMVTLSKAHTGGLKAEFFSIWVEPKFAGHFEERTLDLIDAVRRQAANHPRELGMATTAPEIRRLQAEHRFAMLMGIEGGHSIVNDLAVLRDYYRLGVRYMTLSWSNTNDWADSSGDIDKQNVQHHNGLTDFGKQVVLEMNRLGMMVDISHVSDKTFWDAIAVTKAPVIASHSSARALVNVPRNMTDDMLRAVARNRGVVHINFFSGFVGQKFADENKRLSEQQRRYLDPIEERWFKDWVHGYPHVDEAERKFAAEHLPRPSFSELMDHFVHIIKVAGIDHVGLGSDWDGIDSSPQGMDSCADIPRIVQGLLDRGYSEADIRKVLGENTLRVMREVEHIAAEQQTKPDSVFRSNSGPFGGEQGPK